MAALSTGAIAYDDRFFEYILAGSARSAATVIPIVLRHFALRSVVDIGCGQGAWLAGWSQAGISDYHGVDGDYVEQQRLLIPEARFTSQDLTSHFDLGRKFDLVASLEVGEHIRPDAMETFVDNLCTHADAILFSAAVPGQGGTLHVNEQSYGFWRDRFADRGYRLFDFVRPNLAGCRQVEPWYRYNSLFFARGGALERLSAEAGACEIVGDRPVPDNAPLAWRARNAIIKRLPLAVSDLLVELKHRVARWRHA